MEGRDGEKREHAGQRDTPSREANSCAGHPGPGGFKFGFFEGGHGCCLVQEYSTKDAAFRRAVWARGTRTGIACAGTVLVILLGLRCVLDSTECLPLPHAI